MAKKWFFATIYDRFRELVTKLIGVKGMFVGLATYTYIASPSNITLAGFFGAWLVFIGAREAARFKGLLPLFKDSKDEK